jgi:hypothetical protein
VFLLAELVQFVINKYVVISTKIDPLNGNTKIL